MNNTIKYTVDNDGIATLMIDLPGKQIGCKCNEEINGKKQAEYAY